MGAKMYDSWHRWSHYVVRYLIPSDDISMQTASSIFSSGNFIPGDAEMMYEGDELSHIEHFSDRDFIGKQPKEGFQVVKVLMWYKPRD